MTAEMTKEAFYKRCGFKEDEIDKLLNIIAEGFYQYCLAIDPKDVDESFHLDLKTHKNEVTEYFNGWSFLEWSFRTEVENGVQGLPPVPLNPEDLAFRSISYKLYYCSLLDDEEIDREFHRELVNLHLRLTIDQGLSEVEIEQDFEKYFGPQIEEWKKADKW